MAKTQWRTSSSPRSLRSTPSSGRRSCRDCSAVAASSRCAPEFDALAQGGGREVKMPFWKDLTATGNC